MMTMKIQALVLLLLLFFVPSAIAQETLKITISTDSSSYNPSEAVRLNGKVTLSENPVGGAVVVFEARNPQNSVIGSGYASTSSEGNYGKEFVLQSDATSGLYTIYVNVNYQGQMSSAETRFSVPRTVTAATTTQITSRGNPLKCLIATATYGSELMPEVQFLRAFRDGTVISSFAGRQFMVVFNAWYYSFSPTVSEFISTHSIATVLMRGALYPLMEILRLSSQVYSLFSSNAELAIVVTGLMAALLIGGVYLSPLMILFLYGLNCRVKVRARFCDVQNTQY